MNWGQDSVGVVLTRNEIWLLLHALTAGPKPALPAPPAFEALFSLSQKCPPCLGVVRALPGRYDLCKKTGASNEKGIPVFNALW